VYKGRLGALRHLFKQAGAQAALLGRWEMQQEYSRSNDCKSPMNAMEREGRLSLTAARCVGLQASASVLRTHPARAS
jgi:hypothetical protein